MEQLKLYCLIYELRGVVDSLSNLSDYDENYHNPITDKLAAKTNEIIDFIENDVLLERPRMQLEKISKGIGD